METVGVIVAMAIVVIVWWMYDENDE